MLTDGQQGRGTAPPADSGQPGGAAAAPAGLDQTTPQAHQQDGAKFQQRAEQNTGSQACVGKLRSQM